MLMSAAIYLAGLWILWYYAQAILHEQLETTISNQQLSTASFTALLDKLEDRPPDIVISDYRLANGENGFDVIKAVRQVWGNDLPAIVITGDTDPALVGSMAKRGIAVHYKPLDLEALKTSIDLAVTSDSISTRSPPQLIDPAGHGLPEQARSPLRVAEGSRSGPKKCSHSATRT